MPMEQYEVVEQIGRGAYGSAYLVHHKAERKRYLAAFFPVVSCSIPDLSPCGRRRRYVMKKIRLSKQNDKFQRTAYQEVRATNETPHAMRFPSPPHNHSQKNKPHAVPLQMSLMASLSNPYIVEYKDGWVDEVQHEIHPML